MTAQHLRNQGKPRMMEVQNQTRTTAVNTRLERVVVQMKKSIFRAVLVFVGLYIPLHLVGVSLRLDWFPLFVTGVGCGLLGAWVGRRLKLYSGKQAYGRDLAVFLGLYAAVLLISVALFYTAPGYGVDSAVFTVFYYFPQMLIVEFMIPAIVVYWGLLYVWRLRKITAARMTR